MQEGVTVQTDDVTAVEGSAQNARAVSRSDERVYDNDSFHRLVPSITSCFSEKHFRKKYRKSFWVLTL